MSRFVSTSSLFRRSILNCVYYNNNRRLYSSLPQGFVQGRSSFSVKVDWVQNSTAQFKGSDANGQTVLMSGSEEPGLGPMKLLLMSLGGCVAVDLVSIMKKQRQQVESVSIHVEGQRDVDHPRPLTAVHTVFTVTGTNLDKAKVDKAIELSWTKYCGVHASLEHGVKALSWGSQIVNSEK